MSTDGRLLDGERMGAWHEWIVAARTFTAHLDRLLGSEVDLALVDFELLDGLGAAPEPVRMCDLGSSVALTRSGATRAVTRLENLGLVRRLPSPTDRRSTVVELTTHGREVRARAALVVEREVESNFVGVLGAPGTLAAGEAARQVRAALRRTPACRARAEQDAASRSED